MNRRIIALTGLFAMALSACTTASVGIASPIEARWVGQSAGGFFAKYSPPISDTQSGSSTIYSWRGGYTTIKQKDGRSVRASCSALLTVSSDYTIRSIKITADRPGANGPSYCEELLTAN